MKLDLNCKKIILSGIIVSCFGLQACTEQGQSTSAPEPVKQVEQTKTASAQPTVVVKNDRQALFGDLHVHTMYSFDAFIFGTTASPDDAYEFAKGGALKHPGGIKMQLKQPLDFYGVTDHAFYLGSLRAMADTKTTLSKHPLSKGMDSLSDADSRKSKFLEIRQFLGSKKRFEILDETVFKHAWDDIVASANRHNDPGKFTTFVAYEYTTTGKRQENLHRNVIFESGKAPDLPFSRIDSTNPEDLWQWMDDLRENQGIESLAIPHNSNGSNGEMFKLLDSQGNPLDAKYAELRMRNEPLVEISQVKGTSDTHPALSPNDEWADFEIMSNRIASDLPSKPKGSYVREAWMNGIEMQSEQNFNPYQFGVIGSSDTHNASYAGAEDDYWSKVGLIDDEGEERGSVPISSGENKGEYADTYYKDWSAAGLAGVWADENTRPAIYAGFRRKETFGTSGPRIKVRLFAGYNMPKIGDADLVAKAYQQGVPMGAELKAKLGVAPEFIVWASRDANSAALQRLQVVKASVQAGKAKETVFDVACDGGTEPDPVTHRCVDNGAKVNLADCSISKGVGSAELKTLWRDPNFDAGERAFYYVRVLENPTCRWSTWDAIRAGTKPNPALHATIQERAWSSPIWIEPAE